MKTITVALLTCLAFAGYSQESEGVRTLFSSPHKSGGYGAISNKFTTINGGFANMPEIYGGWFVGKKFLLGVGGGATTNFIRVPQAVSASPGERMSYMYGQFGMVNEFVIASNSPIHPVIHMFNGSGFSLQYERPHWDDYYNYDPELDDDVHDLRWYYISEVGVQIELNFFRWMRVSPGVSYRFAFDGSKMNDDISGPSVSLAMKFGKF